MNPSLDRKPGSPPAARRGPGLIRAEVPTVAEVAPSIVTLRRAGSAPGSGLSREDREQLIADARAGKLVSVVLEAVTFIQRETPNRNLTRFKAGVLRTLAPSFAGVPVLRNHDQHLTEARAGRVLSSVLEDRAGEPGVKQIRMELELTAPWAVEDAARGNIDRFSIGWHSEGDLVCSICSEPMIVGWGVYPVCEHEIGGEYDGQICQLEFTDAVGVEVSAVNVPAVVGTVVDDIRAQLSAARASCAPIAGRKENPAMKNFAALAILAALGLPDESDEASAVAGIGKLKTDLEGARAALGDAQTQLAAASSELATARAQATEQRKASLLKRGLDEGRWVPNSKSAAHAEKLAARGDLDGLEAFIDDLPAGGAAPTQQGLKLLQSGGGDPTPAAGGAVTELSERQLKYCAQMGIEPAAYLKTLNEQNSR